MSQQPNILFAFADDWGRYANIYKHHGVKNTLCPLISTPNIDRIGREGALFTNAFVPAPTCTPCRSSVLSGRYFWQTRLGAILQGAVWDDQIPTYPRILEAQGYHVGATYKTWGPGVCAGQHPYGDKDHHFNNAGQNFNNFSHVVTAQVQSGVDLDTAKNELYHEVEANFNDFLNQRPEGAPFCYWWGPTNTHRTWEKGSGKQLWNLEPDDLKGQLPSFFSDVHDVREDLADYLGECMAYDQGLGVILKILETNGELDNTLVVVSGDHGIPGFPRAKCNLYDIGCEVGLLARLPGKIAAGLVIDDMTNIMSLAPTFLEVGGCSPEPSMASESLWGRLTGNVEKTTQDWLITGRERHVAAARQWNLPYPQRALRTKDYLYIYNFTPDRWPAGDPMGMDDLNAPSIPWESIETNTRAVYADFDASPTKAWMIHHRNEPEHTPNFLLGFDKRPLEELYDLNKDPHQMVNLADNAAYFTIKQKCHDDLFNELKRQRDPRVCDDIVRYENSPFTDVLDHGGPHTQSLASERLSRSGD